jgi:ribosomal protein L30/L7E
MVAIKKIPIKFEDYIVIKNKENINKVEDYIVIKNKEDINKVEDYIVM